MKNLKYASFPARLLAMSFDLAILLVLQLGIASVCLSIYEFSCIRLAVEPDLEMFSVLNSLVCLINFMAYFTITNGYFGATMGKILVGIKVQKKGKPLTVKESFMRSSAYLVSSTTYLVGFIFPLFREDSRSLHDLICDTDVVFITIKTSNVIQLEFPINENHAVPQLVSTEKKSA